MRSARARSLGTTTQYAGSTNKKVGGGPGSAIRPEGTPTIRVNKRAGLGGNLEPFVDKVTGVEYRRMALVLNPERLLRIWNQGYSEGTDFPLYARSSTFRGGAIEGGNGSRSGFVLNYLDKRTQTYYCEPLERFRMERCLVSSQHGTYEIRCPVHGFIDFNDWERQIINHRAFQRLPRIGR